MNLAEVKLNAAFLRVQELAGLASLSVFSGDPDLAEECRRLLAIAEREAVAAAELVK